MDFSLIYWKFEVRSIFFTWTKNTAWNYDHLRLFCEDSCLLHEGFVWLHDGWSCWCCSIWRHLYTYVRSHFMNLDFLFVLAHGWSYSLFEEVLLPLWKPVKGQKAGSSTQGDVEGGIVVVIQEKCRYWQGRHSSSVYLSCMLANAISSTERHWTRKDWGI